MDKRYKSLLILLYLLLIPAIIFIWVKPPTPYISGASADEKTKPTEKTGFFTEGGKLYYYANGIKQKGGIVGPATPDMDLADDKGVCCTSEEIRLAANYVEEYGEGNTAEEKLASCFTQLSYCDYERDHFHPSQAEDIPSQAISMFNSSTGNCYKFAACFACIARVLGYPSRVIIGTLPQSDGNTIPHAWNEVYIDDYWYSFDANAQMQEYWNDLYYFKMTYHNWDTIVYDSFELSVNDDGIAVWESIYTDGYDHSEEYAVDEEDYGYYDEYGDFIYYE